MRVLPVIDLMRGEVVRGIAGRRHQYRAIQSILASDARPETVGRALVAAGFREVYVADLDAIAGAEPAWSTYEALMSLGLSIAVDAGLSTAERARPIARFASHGRRLSAIVAGLESIAGPNDLAALCATLGPARLTFSLDMKSGRPLARSSAWAGLGIAQIADIAVRAGVRRMIVLDLAAVGMGGGVGTEPLLRTLRCRHPEMELIAGGGVRGWSDLRSLSAAGCDAALVASALHDGRLPATACASMR
jgi:phosphoribosylformimino-5-aminoimidazole carboxamide ribotide isomerase